MLGNRGDRGAGHGKVGEAETNLKMDDKIKKKRGTGTEGEGNGMEGSGGTKATGPGATGTLSSVDESDRQGHDGNTLLYRHVHGRSLANHFAACNG